MICYKRFTLSETRIWCSDLLKRFDGKSFNISYLSSIQNKNIKNENENDYENENENIQNGNENENKNGKLFTANRPASKYSLSTRNINQRSP